MGDTGPHGIEAIFPGQSPHRPSPLRRGFTLIEVLVVGAVLAILFTLSFPVFASVRAKGRKTMCVNQLKQIGIALSLYREQHEGADVGEPAAMGLPLHLGLLDLRPALSCTGIDDDSARAAYYITWPEPGGTDRSTREMAQFWAGYVARFGGASIVVYDPHHQNEVPKSQTWQSWDVTGLRLDGCIVFRRNMGFPRHLSWWHPGDTK